MNYHADTTRISKSGLDLINRSPILYYNRYFKSEKQKEANHFIEGRALHTLVLEPENFGSEFQVGGNLSAETYMKICKMRDSIMSHPYASVLINKDGIIEQQFNWIDAETGAACKIKPDKFIPSMKLVIDLKTTVSAQTIDLKRSIKKFRYHVQNAFYMDGLIENGYEVTDFLFICIEKTSPFLVNIVRLSAESIEKGRQEYKNDLATYVNCRLTNTWGGYGFDIKTIEI